MRNVSQEATADAWVGESCRKVMKLPIAAHPRGANCHGWQFEESTGMDAWPSFAGLMLVRPDSFLKWMLRCAVSHRSDPASAPMRPPEPPTILTVLTSSEPVLRT